MLHNKLLLPLIVFLISVCSFAQNIQLGKVVNGITKQPLVDANLFVANTTFKSITDDLGQFSITAPTANFQLIVSYVGFETMVFESKDFKTESVISLELFPEINQLKDVSILSARDRELYLKIFSENLLGTGKNAEKTKILNLNDVWLQFDSEKGILEVSSDNPLILENKRLNYKIKLLLTNFVFDFKNQFSAYSGYPSFENLLPSKKINAKKIAKNRRETYLGSATHFFKSVFDNNFKENGFWIDNFCVMINPLFPSDTKLNQMINDAKNNHTYFGHGDLPSRQIRSYNLKNVNKDFFVKTTNNQQIISFFDLLEVIYTPKKKNAPISRSQIKLQNDKLQINADGRLSDIEGVVFYGEMSKQKMADMLPFDYKLEEE